MNEKQLHNLMQCGLLDGFAAALQSDFFFIIQEVYSIIEIFQSLQFNKIILNYATISNQSNYHFFSLILNWSIRNTLILID